MFTPTNGVKTPTNLWFYPMFRLLWFYLLGFAWSSLGIRKTKK